MLMFKHPLEHGARHSVTHARWLTGISGLRLCGAVLFAIVFEKARNAPYGFA